MGQTVQNAYRTRGKAHGGGGGAEGRTPVWVIEAPVALPTQVASLREVLPLGSRIQGGARRREEWALGLGNCSFLAVQKGGKTLGGGGAGGGGGDPGQSTSINTQCKRRGQEKGPPRELGGDRTGGQRQTEKPPTCEVKGWPRDGRLCGGRKQRPGPAKAKPGEARHVAVPLLREACWEGPAGWGRLQRRDFGGRKEA